MQLQPPPAFGFFEWNIPEDKIVLCQRLSEMLAFDTTNTTQSYNAWRQLTHPDDLAHVDALHKKAVVEKDYYVSSETRKLCRDGKWRWFSLNEKIIETSNEKISLRVTGMCTDITKTKNAELIIETNKAERNELNAIISFFIEHGLTQVAIFDTEMRHKFVNTAWKKYNKLGNQNDFIGKTHYELYPEQPAFWRENHQKALNGETIKFSSEKVHNFYGETVWFDGVVLPWYTSDGAVGGIIIYETIVTERIKAENDLKEYVEKLSCSNQALAYSNQALDRFAHVCSHDLKEPLRGISNFTQLLLKLNAMQFDEESLLYARHVIKGIERMDTLIKDILSYSEVIKQAKVHVDLNSIISDIKETYSYKILETGAHINIGILPTILGFPTQINQLLTNLISNAFKFSSEKPLCIDIYAIKKENFWEFHVCDNGIGIAPEYHTSIFEMFKRLHSKNQYEGSGIGLATCKKIVNDHDGTIYVQSNPEGGSDFVFTLPKMNV